MVFGYHISGPPILEYILYFTAGLTICGIIFACIVWCLQRRLQRATRYNDDQDTIEAYIAEDRKRQLKEAMTGLNKV